MIAGKRRRALEEESRHEESEEEGEESEEEEEEEGEEEGEESEEEEGEEEEEEKEFELPAHDVDPDHGYGKYLSEELYNECAEHFAQADWDLLEPLEVGDDLPDPLPAAIVASIREQAAQRLQMYKCPDMASGDADMDADLASEQASEDAGEEAGEEAVSDIGAPPAQNGVVEHAARPEADVEGPPGLTDADRINALTAENAFLKSEVEKYKKWSKGWRRYANELRANVGVPGAAMPANWEQPPFKLGFVMPLHYDTVQPPHKFKKGKTEDNPYGIRFPHHVLLNNKTGLREYIVENRSLMVIHVGLFRHEDNQPAKETDMTRAVVPRFKLQLVYADPPSTGDVVKTGDMRTAHPHLFDPPEEQSDESNMVDGAVTWTLKVLVTSRDTHNPSNRKFRFRVTCLNEELENCRLKIESEPFRILSRVNKKGEYNA